MKRKRIGLLAVVMISAFVLGGCGTPLYELTESEEEVIVHYAAYALAKHNTFQKDGMKEVSSEAIAKSQEKDTKQESDDTEQNIVDGDPPSQDADSGGTSSSEIQVQEQISLAKAIGHEDDLEVTYTGYSIMDNYQEGSYYSLDADTGKIFLVTKFSIRNPGAETVAVNLAASNLNFSACVNGTDWVDSKLTFLLYSMSTYEGELKAGEQVEVVLLFELSKEQAKAISDISLRVERGGVVNSIKM